MEYPKLLLAYRASVGVQRNLSCAFVRTIREGGRLTEAIAFCLCADGHFYGRLLIELRLGSRRRSLRGSTRNRSRGVPGSVLRDMQASVWSSAGLRTCKQNDQDQSREPSYWSDCTEWSNRLDAFRSRDRQNTKPSLCQRPGVRTRTHRHPWQQGH